MSSESNTTSRIDVHAHYLPPGYRETAIAALKGVPDGMPSILKCEKRSAQCLRRR